MGERPPSLAERGSAGPHATTTLEPLASVRSPVLDVAYHEAGPADGPPAPLLHGFPFDIHS